MTGRLPLVLAAAGVSLMLAINLLGRRLSSSLARSTGATAIMVSVPSAEVGVRIADVLVQENLAACAQIIPAIQSIYRWQGKVEHDTENLLLIKTRTELFEVVAEKVAALHPYDTPEILALPVEAGSSKYLDWLMKTTKAV